MSPRRPALTPGAGPVPRFPSGDRGPVPRFPSGDRGPVPRFPSGDQGDGGADQREARGGSHAFPQRGDRTAPSKRGASRRRHAGRLSAQGMAFALVVSRFNQVITARLLDGALDMLVRLGASPDACEVITVPGAFEIPAAAREAAATGRFHAVICLGLILRGDTPHFDFISHEVTRGVGQSALDSRVPHAFGVLTCDTLEQALQRSGLKAGNKGAEAAIAAVEMANLVRALRHEP